MCESIVFLIFKMNFDEKNKGFFSRKYAGFVGLNKTNCFRYANDIIQSAVLRNCINQYINSLSPSHPHTLKICFYSVVSHALMLYKPVLAPNNIHHTFIFSFSFEEFIFGYYSAKYIREGS